MNYDIANRIMEEKPSEAAHLYIDETHTPRDKHIENLFRDAFAGQPLDDTFRTNFEVYFQMLTDTDMDVPRSVFVDAFSAQRWIDRHIGDTGVREMTKRELAREGADPELRHLRWRATIKSAYATKVDPVYAPSALHALLLAAIMVFRAEATKRLNVFFAPAIKG